MTQEVRKKLGEPKNDLERDTLNYIEPLITEMIGEDIIGKGLTLKGCLESCFKKGKKFEVKEGSHGVARISEEQHFKWVREYFGIEGILASDKCIAIAEPKKPAGLSLDFDSLLD